jgi:acetolactate synthase-1/3 small subunit
MLTSHSLIHSFGKRCLHSSRTYVYNISNVFTNNLGNHGNPHFGIRYVSHKNTPLSTDDLSEDAYDNPDSAPPIRAPRALAPIDVAESLVKGVRDDKKASANTRTHVMAVLVENESGVLSKISGLLSARGFNIESLTVSPTNIASLSRMTIVIRDVPNENKAAQALKQLSDVVNVWAVVDYTGTNSLQRELVMVKVAYQVPPAEIGMGGGSTKNQGRPSYKELLAAQSHKLAVRDLGQLFGAEVVDVGSRHIVFQLTSWSRRVDAFIRMLEPWGIIEVARSGVVAMLRSPVAGSYEDKILIPASKANIPDASQLPPG